MIIEGLLTTTHGDGSSHVAPMGPVVDAQLQNWTLRPFASSTTFHLLRTHPHCVFHVVDDVLPVVEAALGLPTSLSFERQILADGSTIWTIPTACHWFHLEVTAWDTSQARSRATARVLEQRIQHPFWGWNRAKHAILEATILATRLHLADRKSINEDFARLETAIQKTAGARELHAWKILTEYLAAHR